MIATPEFLYWYRARVVNVVDGDTLDLETDLGFRITFLQRYRLYGVDTPELSGIVARLQSHGVSPLPHAAHDEGQGHGRSRG